MTISAAAVERAAFYWNVRKGRSRKEWLHCLLGPTTLHLKHEFYLWLSLSILSVSTLQAIYGHSFGLSGDYYYCLLASAWLSRHFFLRWLCTSDISTTRSPTLTGVLAHWITSLIMVGQYMDRPDTSVVAKHAGTAHHGVEEDAPTLALLPSLTYTIQYIKIRFCYPFWHAVTDTETGTSTSNTSSQRQASNERSRKDSKNSSATTSSSLHQWVAKLYAQLAHFWHNFGPGVQPLLVLFVMVVIIWNVFVASPTPTKSRRYALTMATGIGDYTDEETTARGAYSPLDPIAWSRVLLFMSAGSTLACIVLYGRILLPIPDLVAGSNVLKAVRNESRGNVVSKSKNIKATSSDMPWNENYKSISTENRFRLFIKVSLLRMLDAVITCVLLSRTTMVCRATGHCPNAPTWGDLARILYRPSETTNSNNVVSSTFAPDLGSTIITLTSVILITSVLLLAQLVTLEKSYLAIMGYISGEWKLVPDAPSSSVAAPWDSRRRYKKGDLIVHSYPGFPPSIYMATSNSPEGRPFDLSLRVTHDLFRQDLGHVSTSMVISYCSSVHVTYMAGILLVGMFYTIRGANASAIVTAFVANLVASFGLVQVGLMDYGELQSIAKEINVN